MVYYNLYLFEYLCHLNMIYKDQLTNFTYDPVQYLKGKDVCVEGEVGKFGNKPVMKISKETELYVEEK